MPYRQNTGFKHDHEHELSSHFNFVTIQSLAESKLVVAMVNILQQGLLYGENYIGFLRTTD